MRRHGFNLFHLTLGLALLGGCGASSPDESCTRPACELLRAAQGYDAPQAAALVELMAYAYRTPVEIDRTAPSLGVQRVLRVERAGMRADVYRVLDSEQTGSPVDVISFRGTEVQGNLLDAFRNVMTDLSAIQTRPLEGLPGGVHSGFAGALDALWQGTSDSSLGVYVQQHPHHRYWITGHSLGGALATLVAPRLARVTGDDAAVVGIYTFGSPRVGNRAFAQAHDARFGRGHFRIALASDIVPHLAPAEDYEHDGLRLGWLLTPVMGHIESYVHLGRFCWHRQAGRPHPDACASAQSGGQIWLDWRADFQAVLETEGLIDGVKSMSAAHFGYLDAIGRASD